MLSAFEEKPKLVPRVLEVVKGKLCYIVGTVYMDMPLKPNVLIDLARDVSSFVLLNHRTSLTCFPLELCGTTPTSYKILLAQ